MQRYFGKTFNRFWMRFMMSAVVIGLVFAVGLLIGYGFSSDQNMFHVFTPALWQKIMSFIIG